MYFNTAFMDVCHKVPLTLACIRTAWKDIYLKKNRGIILSVSPPCRFLCQGIFDAAQYVLRQGCQVHQLNTASMIMGLS